MPEPATCFGFKPFSPPLVSGSPPEPITGQFVRYLSEHVREARLSGSGLKRRIRTVPLLRKLAPVERVCETG